MGVHYNSFGVSLVLLKITSPIDRLKYKASQWLLILLTNIGVNLNIGFEERRGKMEFILSFLAFMTAVIVFMNAIVEFLYKIKKIKLKKHNKKGKEKSSQPKD